MREPWTETKKKPPKGGKKGKFHFEQANSTNLEKTQGTEKQKKKKSNLPPQKNRNLAITKKIKKVNMTITRHAEGEKKKKKKKGRPETMP